MRKTNAICSLLLVSATAFASPVSTTAVISPIPVSHVYAPIGFDSNDNTEVIVRGYLPNLCYRSPNARSQIIGNTILIDATALHPSVPVICAQVVVPYLESAQVGILDPGTYRIVVNPTGPTSSTSAIQIVQATSPAIDDNVYANITSVERIPGTRTIILKGTNPVNCYELGQIKYISNGRDTYSVLPILKQVSPTCDATPVPFSYTWDVPTDFSATEEMPLLHIRTMNGKSFNTIFNESQ